MKESFESCEIISFFLNEKEGIKKIFCYFINIIKNCIDIFLFNRNCDYFELILHILCSLLEFPEGREVIQTLSNFREIQLYNQICSFKERFSIESLCSLFMQISRASISRASMYQCQEVLPVILSGLNEINNTKLNKKCLICLMNLSGEKNNRISMFIDDILIPVIRLARQYKGKLRQCSIGILLNLSFLIETNYQYGNHLIEFPQFLESVILASNATELTTKCYAVGIFCNLTTCVENRIKLIQLPICIKLFECLMNILISYEHVHDAITNNINSSHEVRSEGKKNTKIQSDSQSESQGRSASISHSYNSSHIDCLQSDCYQILQNLTSPLIISSTSKLLSSSSSSSSSTSSTFTSSTPSPTSLLNQYKDLHKQWIIEFILHNNCSFLYHFLKLLLNFNKKNTLQLKYFQIFDNILLVIIELISSNSQQKQQHPQPQELTDSNLKRQYNLTNLNKIMTKITNNFLNLLNNFQYLVYNKAILINFINKLNENNEIDFLSDEKEVRKSFDFNVKKKSIHTERSEDNDEDDGDEESPVIIRRPVVAEGQGNEENSINHKKQNSSVKGSFKTKKNNSYNPEVYCNHKKELTCVIYF